MKYRMYVDESGNPGLESSENPNHRYLSLTGIIIELNYASEVVHSEMEQLKKQFFKYHPDEPIIFHRKEIVNFITPFNILKDEELRLSFDNQLLSLLQNWDYRVISVCIDKKSHKDTYTTWRYDPYHYCLAVMLERYFFFLKEKRALGDVMAESRGGKEDRRLKDSFKRLVENGTDFVSESEFQHYFTSTELKVKPKQNNISGLQIADLIAHPSRNEILFENKAIINEPAKYAREIINIIQNKYYTRDGVIKGYGKKFIA